MDNLPTFVTEWAQREGVELTATVCRGQAQVFETDAAWASRLGQRGTEALARQKAMLMREAAEILEAVELEEVAR